MSGIVLAMDGLTPKQVRILEFYRSRAENGLPAPTHRELCKHFGWRSTATARDAITLLRKKSVLMKHDKSKRGYYISPDLQTGTRLPVFGHISAGKPLLEQQDNSETVSVPNWLLPSGRSFVLRVNGDSMTGAGICDGDFVVVRATSRANVGAIVVATVLGETTLKRLQIQNGQKWLVAENPSYKPIAIGSEGVLVQGVVEGVMRRL